MADLNPVPPPPPPPRMNKPVPPPPPGKSATSPASAPTSALPPAAGSSGSPLMPGASTPKPAMAASMPGVPRPGGSNSLDQRMQEMERRFQEQDSAKKALEDQINDLQNKLKDEHEKVMVQSIKAKEEEALASRVEQQLRDMQDKLRREKYEQELHESRGKAESQLKELERRMIEERETWMVALKNQLKEREVIERETEQGLNRRLQDFEKRYQAEKAEWALTLRQKEDEAAQTRRELNFEIERLKEAIDAKDDEQDDLRETMIRERRAVEQQAQSEMRALQAQVETHMRESGTWKAQVAMLQSQLAQNDLTWKEEKNRFQGQLDQLLAQQKEERVRWQTQLRRQEEEYQDARLRLETQAASREEELKREYARRDNDRAKHWEDIVNQMRAEKDVLRHDLKLRDEALAKTQIRLSGLERDVEVERSEWRTDQEKIKRAAKEEALRELPVAFQLKLDTERKIWEDSKRDLIAQHEEAKKAYALRLETQQAQSQKERAAMEAQNRITVQELKTQLSRALETQSAVTAKLNVEERRTAQDKEALRAAEDMITSLSQRVDAAEQALIEEREKHEEDTCHELAVLQDAAMNEQAHWERQTKELMHRVAQSQLREESSREEFTKKVHDLSAEVETLKNQIAMTTDTLKQEQQHTERVSDNLKTAAHNIDALESHKTALEHEVATLKGEVQKLMQQQVEFKNKEKEFESAQMRLREAFSSVKTEMVQSQSDRNQREADWQQKEMAWKMQQAAWEKEKQEWESKPKISLVETASGGSVAAGPEAAKALTAIRQQMQEMQTLLTWLRPKNKLGKAA